jgi:hypothetical protein
MRVALARLSLPSMMLALAACDGSIAASDPSLTLNGSAGAPPSQVTASLRRIWRQRTDRPLFTTAVVSTGDPASIGISMYALYLSANGDCSDPVLVQDYGQDGVLKDLAQNPVLFSTQATDGTYQCVLMEMSDVIGFRPAATFGNCDAATDYRMDIYRDGQTDWKDADLNQVTGSGTDEAPVDDHVTIAITMDTTAAITRGFSTNQVIPLASPLVVPSQSTFYWNGDGSVTTADDGRPCGLEPGRPAFD